jgi:hypothetical protein
LYALDQTGDQAYLVTMPASGGAWTPLSPVLTGANPSHLQVIGNRYYHDSYPEPANSSRWQLIQGQVDDPLAAQVLVSLDDANLKGWFGTDGGVYWANELPATLMLVAPVKAYWRASP